MTKLHTIRGSTKPDVLLIKTGGTIAQKPDKEGILRPSSQDYLPRVEGLKSIANVTIADLGSIDSTNMETVSTLHGKKSGDDRATIAKVIFDNSHKYDGFVVIHGTDTMAETAAALNYMLPNFGKPIVLTGSQRSIWVPRSDAQNNVYTAVKTAVSDIGEVVIAFGNFVLRGSKARKVDEEGYDAFDTPGVEPLGRITSLSEGVRIFDHRIKRHAFSPEIFTEFDTNVFNYYHISGAACINSLLRVASDKEIHGFLIGGFGAGNIPDKLLPFIEKAVKNDKPVYIYTTCDLGAADMGIYSVGAAPLRLGAQSAGDMTLEALGQKLMFALGKVQTRGLVGTDKMIFVESIIKTPYNNDITVVEKRR